LRYFDLHCDTISDCYRYKKSLFDGDLHISLLRGRKYAPWFQCFAIWITDDRRGKVALDYFDAIYENFQNEIAQHSDSIMLCKTSEDFKAARQQKKTGAVLTVEGGAAAAGSLERLQYMADLGVKVMTLTWNSSCEIGDGAGVESSKGLTEFGKIAVKEMERLHMVVDISHASDKLFYDVADCTEKPIIATHSNSRKICGENLWAHRRNLTDEQFTLIKNRGGLVGINFVPEFLNNSGEADSEDILRHIEHFLSLGGENCVAFGSDFDGTELPKGMTGIESVEEIGELMLRHNYSDVLVNSILFDNAYQFFLSL
jgi:membrane dipeptidase